MTETRRDPWLLTPGPLTTSRTVKEAMLRDWGSRHAEFINLNARVRELLVELAGGDGTHPCVPLPRSGDWIAGEMPSPLLPPLCAGRIVAYGAYASPSGAS